MQPCVTSYCHPRSLTSNRTSLQSGAVHSIKCYVMSDTVGYVTKVLRRKKSVIQSMNVIHRELKNHDARLAIATRILEIFNKTTFFAYRICGCIANVKQKIVSKQKSHEKVFITYPASSFCKRANGLELEPPPPVIGTGTDVGAPIPPPPLSGFAIRPNPIGEEVAAFCAK